MHAPRQHPSWFSGDQRHLTEPERLRSVPPYRYYRAVPVDTIEVKVVVVALIRRGFRYLMVRDDARGGTWFPPAGALQRGEDLLTGTRRIVQRASGYTPELHGIVRISHMPLLPGRDVGHWRFIVEGIVETEALTEKTAEQSASYLLPAELRSLSLRSPAVVDLIEAHARGMATAPLDLYRIGLD